MIVKKYFRISKIKELLINSKILDFKVDKSLIKLHIENRRIFMLKRIELQIKIILIINLIPIMFSVWKTQYIGQTNHLLICSLFIDFLVFISLLLCKTKFGSRYPQLLILIVSWSVTCGIQIYAAMMFSFVEPFVNIWYLMFITQAAIIPVLWQIHAISQIGTIIFYLGLMWLYNPVFANLIDFYIEHGIPFIFTGVSCIFSVYFYEKLLKKELELTLEKEKSEQLLLNILPLSIVQKLKNNHNYIAEYYGEATVLFADIVGFTELCNQVNPSQVVELLNDIFCLFDELAEKYKIEKIKTIGDAYMVVAGLPNHDRDHAISIANMALDMQSAIARFNEEQNQSFRIRIGINTGPVVAGVIGSKKFAYDLWGDTVNTASRMESHGIPGCIQVSEDSYNLLKAKYILKKRGLIKIKGKEEMTTYFLEGVKY